ncbi:MAG: LamG domain-containing protein [Sporocytophaga sp.]|nr:LamG domain-containing protein [Sporocytophaga sp.]
MIYVTIPKYILAGSGYKIRVQSSSPYLESDVNVTIKETPRAINSFSSTNINLGESFDIKSGKVLSFDGVNDQVTAPLFTYPANGGAVTVEFWLKVNAEDVRNSSAFSVGSSHNDRLQAHVPWGDGSISFDYGNLSNPASRIAASYTPYLGRWTHVAFVSSGKANTFKAIYLNGKLVNSSNSSDGNTGTLYGLKIGSFINNTLYMKGMIDEFKIWNVMRTQEDIQAGMNKLIDENTPGLMLYLQMHEGTGSVVKDRSGKGLNGTIIGPVWTTPYTNMGYSWSPATTPASGPNVTASSDYTANFLSTVVDYSNGCVGDYSTKVNVKEGIYTNSVGSNVRYTAEVMQVSFKTNKSFPQGTVFNVQLSDANGNFANPRVIGTGSGEGNVIAAKIPEDITPAVGYRVRVVSANPVVLGSPNPENITIFRSEVVLELAENSNICTGHFGIPVTMNGVYNSDNVFSAILSDINGSFTNPIVLNTLAWSQAGSMWMVGELPREKLLGTYKLRVLSSSPYSYDEATVRLHLTPRAIGSVSTNEICMGEQIGLEASKVLRFGSSRMSVPGFSTPVNGGPVTVEFWINVTASQLSNSAIFGVGSDQNNQLQASCNANGFISFDYGSASNPASRITADFNPYFDKWTHVALVSSGIGNTFNGIYLNGRLVASTNTSHGNTTIINGLKIGSFFNNANILKGG